MFRESLSYIHGLDARFYRATYPTIYPTYRIENARGTGLSAAEGRRAEGAPLACLVE